MRRRSKVDLNQAEIVKALRERGYSVAHTHMVGEDFPDIVVGNDKTNWLVEIKSKGGELTEGQKEFINEWKGTVIVAYCIEDILRVTA